MRAVTIWHKIATLLETNIDPENQCLEDEISFLDGIFSGDMLVSGSVHKSLPSG